MSVVDEKVDVESIGQLDFAPELSCEVLWRVAPISCGLPAVGWVRCKSCNFGVLSSRECWGRTVVAATLVEVMGRGVQCSACYVTGSLLHLFEFRPLEGQS